MRKRNRAKRRFAGEPAIHLPSPRAAQPPIVVGGEFHEEIVRVLAIVKRVLLADFSGGEKTDVSTSRNTPGLDAHHRPEPQPSATERTPRHQHSPIRADELLVAESSGAMDFTWFVEIFRERRT